MIASRSAGHINVIVVGLSIVIGGIASHGFTQEKANEAVESVKHLAVSHLDASLPPVKFEAWFGMVVGRQAKIQWELNDCGEQTGDPKTDGLRDMPMCVGVNADLPDGRKVGVLIHVGTNQKGLSGSPSVFDAYVEASGKRRPTKHLHDLENFVKKGFDGVGPR